MLEYLMLTLTIRQERTTPILGFHPWVFSQAIRGLKDGIAPGTAVRLVDDNNSFLALGYFNSYSQIAVRVWGYNDAEEVDTAFFSRRIRRAMGLRRYLLEPGVTDSCRLINGESDLLPGLIVDKYAQWLVVQFHTRGIEHWKGAIMAALVECLSPKGIYERSDAARRTEADERGRSGLLHGDVPDAVMISEGGLKYLVDIREGQKTGFFLDQRDKRMALRKYCHDSRVLNCFSYTGGFTLAALAGGARHVTSVDSSAPALDLARENVKLNGFDLSRCDFVNEDAKQYLRKLKRGSHDIIVLDPPAFIKDRRKKKEGISGYRGIAEASLRALEPGSVLVTCSCSAHLAMDEFRHVLSEAALRTATPARVIESFTHGLDHPVLSSFIEGEYLKCLFVSVG